VWGTSGKKAVILSKIEKIRADYILRSVHRKKSFQTLTISFDDTNKEIRLA